MHTYTGIDVAKLKGVAGLTVLNIIKDNMDWGFDKVNGLRKKKNFVGVNKNIYF